ncbi:short chain dehydrogenase family protein, partial [Chlamydia psittaci 84-8471/1]
MNGILLGKKAIVTGGSRGIGFAISKLFVEQGAEVEIWGINDEGGKKAAQELSKIGRPATFAKVDVSKSESVKEAVQNFITV